LFLSHEDNLHFIFIRESFHDPGDEIDVFSRAHPVIQTEGTAPLDARTDSAKLRCDDFVPFDLTMEDFHIFLLNRQFTSFLYAKYLQKSLLSMEINHEKHETRERSFFYHGKRGKSGKHSKRRINLRIRRL